MSARSETERPDVRFDPALLAQWRREHRLAQEDVARALDYDQTTISKIERGGLAPTLRFLKAFERHFKVSTRRFYRRRSPLETAATGAGR